jgi:hypothetical protein
MIFRIRKRRGGFMKPIMIISEVDEEGKLHIPEGLALKKGKVQVVISPLDDNKDKMKTLSYSDHLCGRILVEPLRREDIYGDDGR